MRTGGCKYKTYKHDPDKHKVNYNSKYSRQSSAKNLHSNEEDIIEEVQLEDVAYDDIAIQQSTFLQENLNRIEELLNDLSKNIDGDS